MKLRPFLFAVSLAVTCAVEGAHAERLPLQSDFDKCANEADDRGAMPQQGRARIDLLLRRSGQVYAAYVRAQEGVGDTNLLRCYAISATRWQFPPAAVDFLLPYEISMVAGGGEYRGATGFTAKVPPSVFLPAPGDAPRLTELNPDTARATLAVLDDAADAERGLAELAVHRPDRALPFLRAAHARSATNPLALRGLAQALSEAPGGDLDEARHLATELVAFAPDNEVSHEALLRVCLASGDDECAFAQWNAATKGRDAGPRGRILAELQPRVEMAAARLRQAASSRPAGDPCMTEATDEAQALCVVKRCLDAGSIEYAKELGAQNGLDYKVDAWLVKRAAKDRLVVLRPITGATGPRHDAVWLVKLGDAMTVTPTSAEAQQIALRHNSCATRHAARR